MSTHIVLPTDCDMDPLAHLSPAQAQAVDLVLTGQNTFLTGPAGTGKSTTLRAIVAAVRAQSDRPIIVTASTGVAAVALGGTTIHSALGTGLAGSRDELDEAPSELPDRRAQLERRWQGWDEARDGPPLVVVDEVSMLSGDYLDMMDYRLRDLRDVWQAPFGGAQVLLVGDFLQLPPVEGYERTGRPPKARYAFQSEAWGVGEFQTAYLAHSFRQEDEAFVRVLQAVRTGRPTDEARCALSYCVHRVLPEAVKLVGTNVMADKINKGRLAMLDPVGERHATTYRASYYDGSERPLAPDSALAKKLRRCVNAPEVLPLKVGAPVLILRNETQTWRWVNGTRATVTELHEGAVSVVLPDGGVAKIEAAEWELRGAGREVVATMWQVPLRLAWAMTVHKSQGMTLDAAEVNLDAVFAPGQTYVALSRLRTLEGLSLTRVLDWRKVWADPVLVEFYEGLAEGLDRVS